MILLKLAWHSLWNRRASVLLTLLAIALSVALVLGVDYARQQAKNGFLNTIAGTDLVVGARNNPVQLLLSSVFGIGNATNTIRWQSYQTLAAHPLIDWTIPLALGDSHKGYRVLGTTQAYFQYYQYADKQALSFAAGKPFAEPFEAVLGAEVARKLHYQLGDSLIMAHGAVDTHFNEHDDKPFQVVGILQPTGTPLDRTVHISLEGIEALHVDWVNGNKIAGYHVSAEEALHKHLQPEHITAFLVGLKNRATALRVQREFNEFAAEPLSAVIPGVALAELWQAIGGFENILQMITAIVVMTSLVGLLTVLLSTLQERRREMAILRAVGAHPYQLVLLLSLETLVLVTFGSLLGMALLALGIELGKPWLIAEYGFHLRTWLPDLPAIGLMLLIILIALVFSLIPGILAYRRSLQDGLTVRL